MKAWGVGRLGLSPKQFYSMCYADLTLKISAYLEKEAKEWEKTRYLASMIVNVNMPKGKQIAPEKLIKLPTDEVQDVGEVMRELLKNL